MNDNLEYFYYEWLTGWANTICSPYGGPYTKLIDQLYSTEFEALVKDDENRVEDAMKLRMMFGENYGYTERFMSDQLDKPCCLLEIMISLARRIEENVMYDGELDKTGEWFYEMLCSMHADILTDDNYDEEAAIDIIKRVLERKYARNGDGGLFTVIKPRKDMRKVGLWYQANWHLSDLFGYF